MTDILERQLDPSRIEVVDEVIAEILRKKTPAQKVEMVFAANRTARMLVRGGVLLRHPDWDEEEVKREVSRKMLNAAE